MKTIVAQPVNAVSCVVPVVVAEKLPDSCEPHVCCRCGTKDDLHYGPDPFDQDIHHDDTPVWECGNCRRMSQDEI